MATFDRDTQRFNCLGLDLNRPVDSVKEQKYPILRNARGYQYGRIEPRLGMTAIDAEVIAGQTDVHSVRRLNDDNNSTWTRVVGVGTRLATGQAAFTEVDDSYSGDPLALVPYRPDQSPAAFMYVADRSRMRKVDVSGNVHTIGMARPTTRPAVVLSDSPLYKTIDAGQSTSGWSAGGTASAPTLLSAGSGARVDTTVAQIIYDSGTSGWATVSPTAATNIGQGMQLIFDTGGGDEETTVVEEVHPAGTSTTIAAILYDSGSSGAATVVLTTPVRESQLNGMIRNTTQGENSRILAVQSGPDGKTCIRVSTPGTWVVTDSVTVLNSFRCWLDNTHAAAEDIDFDGITTDITEGTGTLTRTVALDLSFLAAGTPISPQDYLHISLRMDAPQNVVELRTLLDVDESTNDFTRNYFWRSIRPSDRTASSVGEQSALDAANTELEHTISELFEIAEGADAEERAGGLGFRTGIENLLEQMASGDVTPEEAQETLSRELRNFIDGIDAQLADENDPLARAILEAQASEEAAYIAQYLPQWNATIQQGVTTSHEIRTTGADQWFEVKIPIASMIRVGADMTRTLKDVAAIRLAVIATGDVTVDFDAWWIGGGYGPDVGAATAIPITYRYRARVTSTGARSNWSPAFYGGVRPQRQQVTVNPPQYSAPSGTDLTTSDIVLDIQRFGGVVPSWHFVGVAENGATPEFLDELSDSIVATRPSEGQVHWQPWPILGVPVSGTTGTVAGTAVADTGTNFNTSWAPGTQIIIDGTPYTIDRVISTSRMEIIENAGSLSAVEWEIPEPVLMSQNLCCMWGDEQVGAMFACGDPVNPGRLYYANPHDPDSTIETNYLDITAPSEPLMNGLVFNQRIYVWSTTRFFQIRNTGDTGTPWIAEEIPNGRGLFSRWALNMAPAPIMAWLATDGIYASTGGAPVSMTDADLYPLFPHEGRLGQTTNGFAPPNIVAAQETELRLSYGDETLYFDFIDTGSNKATLLLAFDAGAFGRGESPGGWFYDIFNPAVNFHYYEEGENVHSLLLLGNDGGIYSYGGNADAGNSFAFQVRTPSLDQQNPRELKLYGDALLDIDSESLNVTVTPGFDNHSATVSAVTVNTASRTPTPVVFGSAWQERKNVSLNIAATISTSARPKLYIWEPRWTFVSAPISALSWEIDATTFGIENWKHAGLFRITHVSTVDISMVVTLDGVAQAAITIPNGSGALTHTDFRVPPWKAKLWKIRLVSSDGSTAFRLGKNDSAIEIRQWGESGPFRQIHPFAEVA